MTAIIGCGYIGNRLIPKLKHTNTLIVRRDESAVKLQQNGYEALAIDFDVTENKLPDFSGRQVFYLLPPPNQGKTDTRMKRFIQHCDKNGYPQRLVYFSTTGVYGNRNGDWVNEESSVNPQADRAWRRLDAEQQLLQWAEQDHTEVVILRVAGIYGPDKLPLARLQKQIPIINEEESPYTNRIYVNDLIKLCLLAMSNGRSGEIYLASDGNPGNMTDYFNQVADATHLPRPKQISKAEAEKTLSAGMLSYLRESRRLNNEKVIKELGMFFDFPDLSSGLKHAIANGAEISLDEQ